MKEDNKSPEHRSHVVTTTPLPISQRTETNVLGVLGPNGLPEQAGQSTVELMRNANRPEGQKRVISESWQSRN